MQAFNLIGAVRFDAQNAGAFDLAKQLSKLESAVEAADCVLEQERVA
jgi:hypothetical protein